MFLTACSSSKHPPHSHTCYSSDIYHGYSDEEYEEIQEEMSEIRYLIDELERKVR